MELLELVKSVLNMDTADTSNDTYLNNLIEFSKAFFTNITGQELSGNIPYEEIFLKQYGVTLFKIPKGPINTINSVNVDGKLLDTSTFFINKQFIISQSQISGEKIVINVNVGYATIPSDINYILASICEFLFKQDSRSNYFSGEKSFLPTNNVLPGYIREIIEGYVF